MKQVIARSWLWCLVLAALVGCDRSAEPADSLVIRDAFMYTPPPGSDRGAIYFVAENGAGEDRVLNYVHSDRAERLEVHQHLHEGGMMKMRPVAHMRFPHGQTVLFKPGGYHLMVFGIDGPLNAGDNFAFTMEFEGGETHEVTVTVRPQG